MTEHVGGQVKATCVFTPRNVLHGKAVLENNIVVLVKEVLDNSIAPNVQSSFDDGSVVEGALPMACSPACFTALILEILVIPNWQ